MNYTDKQIDDLISGIYSGSITVDNLPTDLIEAIFVKLSSAFTEIESLPSKVLLSKLTENLYLFSEAKTYSQINKISLLGENELIKSFADFKKEALQIYNQYNVNWLATEYSTTIAQGQNAQRWEQIQDQKKTLPFLKYSAVIDSHTSDICEPLDGICLPVDDPFWDNNAPTNHFNCRCILLQVDNEDAVITDKDTADNLNAEMTEKRQPLFNDNVGKSNQIFPDNHPYFEEQNGK